jgi:hypothetical protein
MKTKNKIYILLFITVGISFKGLAQENMCPSKCEYGKIVNRALEMYLDSLENKCVKYNNMLTQANIRQQKWEKDSLAMRSDLEKAKPSINDSLRNVLASKKVKCDSLNNILLERQLEILTLNRKIIDEKQESSMEGRNSILEQIKSKYDRSLDELIRDQFFLTYQADETILRNHSIAPPQKIIDLAKYAAALKLLKYRFDEAGVVKTIQDLSTVNGSSLTDSLKLKLQSYKKANDYLLDRLGISISEGLKLKGVDEYSKALLLQNTLVPLYQYLYKYPGGTYQYLNELVLEAIKRKIRDPNADLTDLKGKI